MSVFGDGISALELLGKTVKEINSPIVKSN